MIPHPRGIPWELPDDYLVITHSQEFTGNSLGILR